MADHKSALKRIRQTEKRTARNRSRISCIKTFIKKFMASIGTDNMQQAFRDAQSELHKGVTKGVLHKNTAARKISRLSRKIKAAEAK